MLDVLEITVIEQNTLTVKSFLKNYKKVDLSDIDSSTFLSYTDKIGRTNLDRIKSLYSSFSKKNNENKSNDDLEIIRGTRVVIPSSLKKNRDVNLEGINVISFNTPLFKSKVLEDIENDIEYTQVQTSKQSGSVGKLKKITSNASVFVWCRALSKTIDSENNGQIIDISKYLINVNTNITRNGGSFSITLPPILCEKNSYGGWSVKESTHYNNKENGEFLAKTSITEVRKGDINNNSDYYKRNSFLFENILQNNDVVFIRFEKLESEKRDNEISITPKNLPGKIYDMIGLIDIENTSINFQGNRAYITINGRDLMKLLIDDGSYFFASEFAANLFPGTKSEQFLQRTLDNGKIHYLNAYFQNSIKDILSFIFDKLSSIEIVPDSLFNSYEDKRSFLKTGESLDKELLFDELSIKKLDIQKKSIIKQINDLKNFLQKPESTRILNNPYKNIEDTNDIFNELYSFINKSYNDNKLNVESLYGYDYPFEFEGNIYGLNGNNLAENGIFLKNQDLQTSTISKLIPTYKVPNIYYDSFVIEGYSDEKPSKKINLKKIDFTQYIEKITSILSDMSKLILLEKQTKNSSIQGKSTNKKGIWQITNLIIEESIKHRYLVDSSLASMSGSILNFVRKVCQNDFVEFYGDTYGDRYYWTARKPPFNKKSMLSALYGDENNPNPFVANINDIDVIEENLSYADDKDIFTWFHFTPKLGIFSNNNDYALFLFPPKVFDEYVKIWGNKPYQTVNNYIPYDLSIKNEKDQKSLITVEKQAFEDLRYIIESHIYLPFTRKGTITFFGDRRVKVGNFIRYQPTGEIFYVDSVSQSFAVTDTGIQRITKVNVSRGMVEKYIKEQIVPGYNSKISYFNIVPFRENMIDFYMEDTKIKNNLTKTTIFEENIVVPGRNSNRKSNDYNVFKDYVKDFIKKLENPNGPFLIPVYKYNDWMIGYSKVINPKEQRFLPYFTTLPGGKVISNGKKVPLSLIESLYDSDISSRINSARETFGDYLTANELAALVSTLYNSGNSFNTINRKNDIYKSFRALVRNYINETNDVNRLQLELYYKKFLISSSSGVSLIDRRSKEVNLFFENFNSINVIEPYTNTTYVEKDEIVEVSYTSKVINKEKLYSDIKVNKDVFNFFLRRQQKD